jgi:hypothetical protein
MRDFGKQDYEPADSGIGLLFSLLTRHNEICSATYSPDDTLLGISFLVCRKVGSDEVSALRSRMGNSIEAIWDILRMPTDGKVELKVEELGEYTRLTMTRDVASLTSEEIALIVGIMEEFFETGLLSDTPEDDFDALPSDDAINNMLIDVKTSAGEKNIIGYRDEGRIVVFDKPLIQGKGAAVK